MSDHVFQTMELVDPEPIDDEVNIKIGNDVVKLINETVNEYLERGLGDTGDTDKQLLARNLKSDLLELIGLLNP